MRTVDLQAEELVALPQRLETTYCPRGGNTYQSNRSNNIQVSALNGNLSGNAISLFGNSHGGANGANNGNSVVQVNHA